MPEHDDTTTTTGAGTAGDTPNDHAAEVEKWKAMARKHEERAAANSAAAEQLAQMQADSKTEAEKVAERIAKLEQDNAAVRADALRLRIAAKHQISDEDADLFLTGTDEATLTAQAKRLADRTADQKKQATVVSGEGTTTSSVGDSGLRDFTHKLFSSD